MDNALPRGGVDHEPALIRNAETWPNFWRAELHQTLQSPSERSPTTSGSPHDRCLSPPAAGLPLEDGTDHPGAPYEPPERDVATLRYFNEFTSLSKDLTKLVDGMLCHLRRTIKGLDFLETVCSSYSPHRSTRREQND